MKMPEGWKRRKKQIESIPSPQQISEVAVTTGTQVYFQESEKNRISRLVADELNMLNLMKEMAEALEEISTAELGKVFRGPDGALIWSEDVAREAIKKFKEWK